MRLIAGLGNPGRKYERDRHNVGYRLASRLAERHRVTLRAEPKYHGLVGKLSLPAGELWLVMPQTYMNLSGKSVGALARFYKILPEEILALHDELDFPPGVVKIKFGGGVAGHNGLKDIAASLGSQAFWRIRIGIGHPGDRNLVADYVLSQPSPDERQAIEQAIERCLEVFPLIEAGQMEAATLKLHTQAKT
ncbi:MAG: aminoacyl-tRNA hydrolase [Betaproteobacteria bacterium RIFCSPLOWO2_02_FULL_65_24]|nr:MAG: aminoacyl-tRNA hydrolase [Betaproteobacteria bacterium RIFCSPLOWO2_02_FULL_65_24]OGA71609.1 MAG: aminoacyl-tRNA hydrolase [Betaproteobacteria bacterium RIFCSPLOWO2_12_FULL_66_14]